MPELEIGSLIKRLESLENAVLALKIPIKGDPPPDDLVHLNGDFVKQRLYDIVKLNPGWITDPAPEDFLNVRVLDLIRRFRGGYTDPAPDDLSNVRLKDLLNRIPGGGFTDPSPEDIHRLTIGELEAHLHKIGTEIVRLRSLERVMQERIGQLRSAKK